MDGNTPKRRKDDFPEENTSEARRQKDDYGRVPDERVRDYNRRKRTGWIWPLIALLILLAFGWLLFAASRSGNIEINQNQQNQQFQNEKRTNNFGNSIPEHAQTIPAPPATIIIQTESNSTAKSSLKINKDNKDYGIGSTVIDSKGRVLRRDIDPASPDGIYTVNYSSCGTDGKCQDGNFQFKIDRSANAGFEDLTGRNNVTVSIANGRFLPEKLIISKGTRLTWNNEDGKSHTLFPGIEGVEEFFPNISSGRISSGGDFSLTINEEGWFPYFASNGEIITGEIISR